MHALTVALVALATTASATITYQITPYPGTRAGDDYCKGKHFKPFEISWTTPDQAGPCVISTAPASSNSSAYKASLYQGSTVPAGMGCVVFQYLDTACQKLYGGGGNPIVNGEKHNCYPNGGEASIQSYELFCFNEN